MDRISWALSYLNMASLVEKPSRGVYKAAPSAVSYLEDDMALRAFVRQKAAEHTARKQRER
ncbi:restriction endonuclease Mrr [Microbulbifer hydrolyticus]|uniref:Restriction endonuclease Mrr n=1 Tax=Microbulbifer hydrolyticus TaxID=48074 RepID=A0AA89PL49_9GAMM|nr:restriction endonuclease Mrr [Microbulbifer hydrolyticus]